MRAHDWASTPLGPSETWPLSLRLVLSICLKSSFPTAIYWGPELRLFYNDPWAPIPAERHPWALGRPAREVWPDIWQVLEPQFQQVVETGEGLSTFDQMLPMQRGGEVQETYWNYSLTPIPADDGSIAGVFNQGNETTARVLAERQASAEMQRLAQMFQQAPGAVAVLSGPDHVFEIVNPAYQQLVGPREIIGKPVAAALPEVVGQGFVDLLDRVYNSGEAYVGRAVPIGLQMGRAGEPEPRLLDLVYQPLTDARGKSTGIFVQASDVTERARAEAAMQESEERLGAALTAAQLGTFDWHLRTRAVVLDDRSSAIFGFSPGEGIRDQEVFDRIDPRDFERARAEAQSSIDTLSRLETEYRILRPDGTARTVISISDVIADTDGKAERAVGVFADITESRRTEDALRQSEARFEAIANSIDQLIWSTRPDGYHDYYNQRWYEYTGVPVGSTDGEAWNGLFHPDDQERAWAVWRHSLETGEPYHIEYRLRHRSGHYRWVLGRAQPVRDGTGRIARWFGTCTDIHDLKVAEEERARAVAELRESETRLRELNETLERRVAERTADRDRMWRLTTDVMLVARFSGTITAVNPAWSTLLGWTEADLIGCSFMDFVHPDDRPLTMSEADRLSDGRTTLRFRNRYRHKDGSYRWLSWTAVPDDRFIHAVGRDVTEERERAEALRVTEEALRQAQKMEAIGQLTGGVAHDFNNLLTIIRSSSDLLRRPDLSEERRRRYVNAISDTVDRASKLTGQLLAFARRQALKPEVFDVPARVRSTSDMLRTIVGGRIKIVAEFDCERCVVEADVAQFETALLNMAVNARDAMEGEGTLTIKVDSLSEMPGLRGHAGGPGGFVAVSVADTGSGIPADKLPHIFEPFFTTKAVGKGTGLGLSQVYGFAKQSGGDVSVASEVGRGTTFTLYLPSAEREPDEDDAGGQNEGTAESGRGRRVLVVEDNVEVGTFSTQILSDLGYVTTWAANADEALRLLDETPDEFDVVFSDVVMPGMSGVELGCEIRRRYPGLPVLLTSGYSHVLAEEGRHGFELLQKPYAAEDLSGALRRLARGRRTRARARR